MKMFKTDKFCEKSIQLVRKEIELVQNLKLPNVPNYIEFKQGLYIKKNGKKKKKYYLVMDYIQGVTLFDFFFKIGKPDDKMLRYVFRKVAYCLYKLHQQGFAHRDIKPENVMLTESFEVMIIDLGYGVSLAGSRSDGFTTTYCGTPMYMGPEIEMKKLYQGADVDIFALGVMLITLKAMTYPFDKATMSDQHYRAMQENPKLFWEQDHYQELDLSDEFKEIVSLMCKKNPMARPTTPDVLGHPWMRGAVPTKEEFKEQRKTLITKAMVPNEETMIKFGKNFQI